MAKDPVIWLATSVRKLLDRVAVLEAALLEAQHNRSNEFKWNKDAEVFIPRAEIESTYVRQLCSEEQVVRESGVESPIDWGIGCGSANPIDVDNLDRAAEEVHEEQEDSRAQENDEYKDNDDGTCNMRHEDTETAAYSGDPPSDSDSERNFWNDHGLAPGCFWQFLIPKFKQAPIEDVSEREVSWLLHSAVGVVLLRLGKQESIQCQQVVTNLCMNAIQIYCQHDPSYIRTKPKDLRAKVVSSTLDAMRSGD